MFFELRVVRAEEPWLSARHGEAWQEYVPPRAEVVMVSSDAVYADRQDRAVERIAA